MTLGTDYCPLYIMQCELIHWSFGLLLALPLAFLTSTILEAAGVSSIRRFFLSALCFVGVCFMSHWLMDYAIGMA